MSQVALAPFTDASFETFLAGRDEPAWLSAQRRQAWEAFQKMEWPSRRDEEWMRTDIRMFRLDKFPVPGSQDVVSHLATQDARLAQDVQLGGWTASNGSDCRHQLDARWQDQGVVFCSLEEAARSHPELVQRHLMTQAVDPLLDRFSALHAAFWQGGHFLYVPPGVVVDQPLHSLSAMPDGGTDFGHLLVVMGEGSEATWMTETASDSETAAGLHCGAIELFVRAGARLRFVNLQNWGHQVWHFGHQQALVDRDASLQWTIAAIGSRLAKVNQHVALMGTGAESQVNGVLFTEGRQHLSYHTLQHHQADHCRSDFLYKAALQDQSRTVWRGMIKVDPKAQKTDGYQRNDNLLLSAAARADSIPGLEIEADDVRCTHGSTSGRVDEELIFYAQNRGFTRREAVRMVVTGFFQQVFDRITIDSVRDALALAIAHRVREYD